VLQTRLIQFEVHGFQRNIAHCTILTLLTVESKCTRWRSTMLMSCASVSRLYGMNLTSVLYYGKAIKQWRTRLRAYVEAKGGHFEHRLWRLVQNDRLHECFTFCKKICQVLTLLHQLICRGVANFGTLCSYKGFIITIIAIMSPCYCLCICVFVRLFCVVVLLIISVVVVLNVSYQWTLATWQWMYDSLSRWVTWCCWLRA